jgi:hypothetical protein
MSVVMFSQINRWGQSACLITILSCLLLSTFPGLSPARAGQSYTPRATPYTGAELWYCPPGTGVDNSCFVANLFTYPLTGVTISNPVLTGSITGNGLTNYFANPFTFAGNMTFNSIISNSGSAGYITTVLDNSNDTSNGIQVTGSSTTQAQEIAKSFKLPGTRALPEIRAAHSTRRRSRRQQKARSMIKSIRGE